MTLRARAAGVSLQTVSQELKRRTREERGRGVREGWERGVEKTSAAFAFPNQQGQDASSYN